MKTKKVISKVEDVLKMADITLKDLLEAQKTTDYYTKLWIRVGAGGVEKAFYEMDLDGNVSGYRGLDLIYFTGCGTKPVASEVKALKTVLQERIYALLTYTETEDE
jgi:hypothetical protein